MEEISGTFNSSFIIVESNVVIMNVAKITVIWFVSMWALKYVLMKLSDGKPIWPIAYGDRTFLGAERKLLVLAPRLLSRFNLWMNVGRLWIRLGSFSGPWSSWPIVSGRDCVDIRAENFLNYLIAIRLQVQPADCKVPKLTASLNFFVSWNLKSLLKSQGPVIKLLFFHKSFAWESIYYLTDSSFPRKCSKVLNIFDFIYILWCRISLILFIFYGNIVLRILSCWNIKDIHF